MNPPFGTKHNKGLDMRFLQVEIKLEYISGKDYILSSLLLSQFALNPLHISSHLPRRQCLHHSKNHISSRLA